MTEPATNDLPKTSKGAHNYINKGTRNGMMTSPLRSCDLHQKISLETTSASLKLEALLANFQIVEDESIRQYAPHQNHLLGALPPEQYKRLLPHLELVPMPLGDVLYESGVQLRHVYFPIDSIVSLLYVMEDGSSSEIAVVGHEGLVGISLFMGGETTPSRAVVQSGGYAYRLRRQLLKDEFNRSGGCRPGALHDLLLRYTQALLTQMAQISACNSHHSVDQQLCRLLLMSLDRLHSTELIMTQEQIANMLGVRREGVTEAAGNLQKAGLIGYRRGHIAMLDRPGLEARVCECYAVVKKEFDRLLPEVEYRTLMACPTFTSVRPRQRAAA